jgi:hypothetical protein
LRLTRAKSAALRADCRGSKGGYEERPSFDGRGARRFFARENAAYRVTGDALRRIIQLYCPPRWAPDWHLSALEPSAAATGLPFSVGRAAACRATSSRVRPPPSPSAAEKITRLQSTLSARFILLTNSEIGVHNYESDLTGDATRPGKETCAGSIVAESKRTPGGRRFAQPRTRVGRPAIFSI